MHCTYLMIECNDLDLLQRSLHLIYGVKLGQDPGDKLHVTYGMVVL